MNGNFLVLKAASPALDAGHDAHFTGDLNTAQDLRGTSRKVGASIDLGAYERPATGVLATQTLTFTLPMTAFFTNNPAITLSASSSIPALSAAIAYSSSNPAVASVQGNQLTFQGPGTTVLTARQPGDASYAEASIQHKITVSKHDQTISFSLPKASFQVGDPAVTLMASSSEPTLTSGIVYQSYSPGDVTISGNSITSFNAASSVVTIEASHPGNAVFNEASARLDVVVRAADDPAKKNHVLIVEEPPKTVFHVGELMDGRSMKLLVTSSDPNVDLHSYVGVASDNPSVINARQTTMGGQRLFLSCLNFLAKARHSLESFISVRLATILQKPPGSLWLRMPLVLRSKTRPLTFPFQKRLLS